MLNGLRNFQTQVKSAVAKQSLISLMASLGGGGGGGGAGLS